MTFTSPSAIVYLDYESSSLEPPPSADWTRFVCISDTHGSTFDVPAGDVLLHSGDLTRDGDLSQFETTMSWLYSLPHAVKMSVCSLRTAGIRSS